MKLIYTLLISLSCCALSLGQDFQWANAGEYTSTALSVDYEGNVYRCGYFSGFKDFDPDTNQNAILSSNGSSDMFIQKFNALGDLKWAISIGGPGSDGAYDIKADADGNILLTGGFTGTVDFDPGAGVVNKTPVVAFGNFLLKLDSLGNFIWVKQLAGSTLDRGNKIVIDNANNVYFSTLSNPSGLAKFSPSGTLLWSTILSGNIWTIGIDPFNELVINGGFSNIFHVKSGSNTSVHTLTSNGFSDMFMAKYTPGGYPSWAFSLGGPAAEDSKTDVAFDPHGNIYFAGGARSQIDFDPGPGTFFLPHAGGTKDAFIVKLDPNANFIWAKSFGGPGSDEINEIETDKLGSILVAGLFDGTADFDPDGRVAAKTSFGYTDMFWARYDSLGSFQAVHTFSSPSISTVDLIRDFHVDEENNIYTLGEFSGTVDLSIAPNQNHLVGNPFGGFQTFSAKYSSDTCTYLTLYMDSVADLTCADSGRASMFAKFGVPPYIYSWNTSPPTTDSVLVTDSAGAYTLTVTDARQCVTEKTIIINGPEAKAGFDLSSQLITSGFRAATLATVWINAYNDGCSPVSGVFKLRIPQNFVSYHGAQPLPDTIQGDTLIWNFTNIAYNTAPLTPEVYFLVDTMAPIGREVCFESFILPTLNDVDTTNNHKEYCRPIINSYDPNDKQVYPQGICNDNFVQKEEALTYTIRFQNTGNAPAVNITITDTLNSTLDYNSIRVVAKSHENLTTELLPQNVVRFHFRDIMLPDSTSNEPDSKGYVVFEIKPKTNTTNNTALNNKANIYFDFNQPIITNAVSLTLVDSVPSPYTDFTSVVNCGPFSWNGTTFDSSGTYVFDTTTVLGCDSNLTLDLTVNPVPDASVTQNGLMLSATVPNQRYFWFDCVNQTVLSTDTNQIFEPVQDGSYALIVDNGFCTDTSACFSIVGIGLIENFTQRFSVAPNPSNGVFEIYQNTSKPLTIEVYTLHGKLIYSTTHSDTRIPLSVNGPSGIYTLVIREEAEKATFKLIKL